jgi:hypothetical protein
MELRHIRSRKPRLTPVGTRLADRAKSLYLQKLALTLPKIGGFSVGIVRLRTKGNGSCLLFLYVMIYELHNTELLSPLVRKGTIPTERPPLVDEI